jgi:hypothetical protein
MHIHISLGPDDQTTEPTQKRPSAKSKVVLLGVLFFSSLPLSINLYRQNETLLAYCCALNLILIPMYAHAVWAQGFDTNPTELPTAPDFPCVHIFFHIRIPRPCKTTIVLIRLQCDLVASFGNRHFGLVKSCAIFPASLQPKTVFYPVTANQATSRLTPWVSYTTTEVSDSFFYNDGSPEIAVTGIQ